MHSNPNRVSSIPNKIFDFRKYDRKGTSNSKRITLRTHRKGK